MNAKEYIKKANKICNENCKNCEKCPLLEHSCGMPIDEDIDETLKVIRNYKLSKVLKAASSLWKGA